MVDEPFPVWQVAFERDSDHAAAAAYIGDGEFIFHFLAVNRYDQVDKTVQSIAQYGPAFLKPDKFMHGVEYHVFRLQVFF